MSSVMWDLPCFVHLIQLMGLSVVTTWLGLYGHDLLKPTKLLGNLPDMGRSRVSMLVLLLYRPRRNAVLSSHWLRPG